MPQPPDPRQEERSEIELRVEYQRLNTFFYDYTKNISRGGTFIKTSRPLTVGTVFVFKLVVPTLPEPLKLRGVVRWLRTAAEGPGSDDQPGMGIRFVFEDASQREAVERTVERLMVGSLGRLIYSRLRALAA